MKVSLSGSLEGKQRKGNGVKEHEDARAMF